MTRSEQGGARASTRQASLAHVRLRADALNGDDRRADVLHQDDHQYSRGLVQKRSSEPEHELLWRPGGSVSEKVCPRCHGVGWLRQDRFPPGHPQYASRVECECLLEKRRKKRQQRMLALCVAFGFQREKNLVSFKPQLPGVQEAYKATRRMIALIDPEAVLRLDPPERKGERKEQPASKRWLVLVGPSGRGKTHLAMAVGNAGLNADLVTLFAPVPDVLDHLRKTFHPTSEIAYDELFEQFRAAEVLILDDLGAEANSPWAGEKLFQILNYRYNMGLITVVTMNERAWNSLDQRLQSRLSDKSLVERVSLERAQDFRKLVISN